MLTFETERELVDRAVASGGLVDGEFYDQHGDGTRCGRMSEAGSLPAHVTPLIDRHQALGAKLVEFGGRPMPLQYAGILEEHRAVRERAGLFDLSHMGELFVEGPEAGAALARAVVSDPTALTEGRAQYSMLCAPDGGVIDDLIIYRLAAERFLVVANAANAGVVSDALAERLAGALGDPRRSVAHDGARRHPGSPRRGHPGASHRCGPRRPPLLRHH